MRWTRIVVSALGASLAIAGPARADNPASISLAGAQAAAGYTFPYTPGAVQIEARFGVYDRLPNVIVAGGCEQPVAFYNYGRTQLKKFDCGTGLVPGSCPGACPFNRVLRRAYAWQYRRALRVMRNGLARTMRPAFRVPREGLRRVSSLVHAPGSQTLVSLGVPVTQIEFFFDRRVTGRVTMIRLIDSGCALVVRHRKAPRTFCGLPMQVLGV
ncbi:hypothetical protein OM076_01160 [Solirubrobacter ginsenosidimutans]|uniref:Uncharacterized protein n=1 Tax=Solirubrobacter ginsenosidimutans TaxID=490573 RepID=A0A9X3MN90_9ACTN|nr:hypothetical protein [Solirubrobacter ginsenosidimutans]MDA0158857.1 hypothetical protein [Solirubrobacter ginsenosidimutans]